MLHLGRSPLLLVCLMALAVLSTRSPAATYYVATNGVNTNPGTFIAPFQTIQKAAAVMVAGDTCSVRDGIYRETVVPANSGTAGSPITFQNYSNEVAVISGAAVITGWTVDSGSTYKAALANNFYASPYNQTDQIFVDGNMMTLAKWPNATTRNNAYPSGVIPSMDISHPAKSTITGFVSKNTVGNVTTGVVTDTALPVQTSAFYTGAEIFFQPNNGAWSWTFSGVVSGVSGNQITFTSFSSSGQDGNGAIYNPASRYYLFNKKEFLDAPGEWWHDRTNGQLYAIMPDSGNPATHTVEAKQRDFAFNLSNKSYITVKGLNLFACTLTTDSSSGGSNQGYDAGGNVIYPWRGAGSVAAASHIVIDGISARYLSHFTDVSGHFYLQWGQSSGIVLSGSDCVLQNSTLQYSAGNGVTVLGQRNKVLNNFIYDTAYAGTDAAAINTGAAATTVDHEIATNIISRTGRSGITPRSLQNSNAGGGQFVARIHHNDIGSCMIQDWDGGGFYITGIGQFLRIDHNLVHDLVGFTCSGIYADFSKNYIIDHNVIWNVEWGIHLQGDSGGVVNALCYNNTIAVKNTSGVPYGPFGFGNSSGNSTGTVLANNIAYCIKPPTANGYNAYDTSGFAGATITSNLFWNSVSGSATDPKFLDAANFNFQLLANSPARGGGMIVPTYVRDGITVPAYSDNPSGTRDQGAYEYYSPPVIAGGQTASGTSGSAFSYQLAASGSPTNYALASGTLPNGVTLNTTNGLLSGTPSQTGTFTPSFTASNASGTSSAVVVSIQISPSIASALLVYDGFAGTTVANGGSGWSGNWNAPTFVFSTNLTFGTLQTSGQSMSGTGNFGNATRGFSGLNSGTIWFSYIQKFTGATTSLNALLNFRQSGTSKFGIGQKGSEVNTTFHIYNTSSTSVADTGISVEGSHFVAGSVNLATGLITVYIDPTGLGYGSAPSSAASATATVGAVTLDEINTGSDSARFQLDEFRLGNTWIDASPASVSPALATTMTLMSSLNPSTSGDNLTFTATVRTNAVTVTVASGTVTFKDNAATLGTGTLSGGVATYATGTLPVGAHSITAVYNGDASYAGSTSSGLTQAVNPAPVIPPPTQRIVISGGNVVIQWPTNATGFTLKSNGNLTLPVGSWGTVGTGAVVGTNYEMTMPLGAGATFFQLVK